MLQLIERRQIGDAKMERAVELSFCHCWQELALDKDRGPGTGPQPIPWHERWEHPARIQGWEWGHRELSRRLLSEPMAGLHGFVF